MSWVLVFRIGSMGDSLVAIPALRKVAQDYPSSRILLLTNAPVGGGIKAAPSHQILVGSGLVHDFIEFPSRPASLRSLQLLIARIRAYEPLAAICLCPHDRSVLQNLRDYIFFRLAGIGSIRGLQLTGRASNRRLIEETGRYESEPNRLLRAIGADGRTLSQVDLSLNLTIEERSTATQGLAFAGVNGPFIAISLGTKLPVKDWGQDRWLSFTEALRTKHGHFALVFLGAAIERDRCDALAALWPGTTLNLCGHLSPRASAAVLERASVFVGHDSGPMHLANACGIPVVSIFSSQELPGVWFPIGNESNVFYSNVECRGCRLEECIDRAMMCIRSIDPQAVAQRVADVLSEHRDTLQKDVGALRSSDIGK